MFKTIIKEFGIMLLILIAITLMLVIVLYDYDPNNKSIPKQKTGYELQADIQEELATTLNSNTQQTLKRYTVDSQDLKAYEKQNEYVKYKQNPFRTNSGSSATTPEDDKTNGIGKNTGK